MVPNLHHLVFPPLVCMAAASGRCCGAASCPGCSTCQERGCDIPWAAAAARQRLGRGGCSCFFFSFLYIFLFWKCWHGSKQEGFFGLCLQRSYNTFCSPRHDTAWQNKVFILCTCQLRSAASKMMKYYRICSCLFPLGTCADLFKVSSAPSKRFIYYSWHLKTSEGDVSGHHTDIIFFICCCLPLSQYKCSLYWWVVLLGGATLVVVCAEPAWLLEPCSISIRKMRFDSWWGQLDC